jgi:hypothetical protein
MKHVLYSYTLMAFAFLRKNNWIECAVEYYGEGRPLDRTVFHFILRLLQMYLSLFFCCYYMLIMLLLL